MKGNVLECGRIDEKDKEFWESLRKWDVVVMTETWVEEKGWRIVKSRLPGGFVWGV